MKYFAAFVVFLWSGLMLAAMPASGPISFSQMQTEFGGSNPIGFNEYYRGGTYVPSNASTALIATSGTISFNTFYGASASGGGSASTVSPGSLSGTRSGAGTVTTSGSATCTPTTGGGTYQWVRTSGPVGTLADTDTASMTTFSRIGTPVSSHLTVWRCDYTLGGVTVASSNTINITLNIN